MFLNTSRLRQTVGSMIESRRCMQSTTRWPMAKVILMVQLGSFCSAVHLPSRTVFHMGRRLGARPSADRRRRSTSASAVQSRRAREHRLIQLQDLRTLSCPRTLSFFLSLARKESLLSFAVSCPFVANCSLKKMKFFPSASTSSLLTATSAVILASSKLAAEAGISQSLQNVLKNTHGSEAYHYPTDFTRGIMPVSVQMQPSRSGGDRKLSAGELGAFS